MTRRSSQRFAASFRVAGKQVRPSEPQSWLQPDLGDLAVLLRKTVFLHETNKRSNGPRNRFGPSRPRRSADFQAEVPFQNQTLPMQRRVVAILADDRVDDDAVTRQALLDDPWWQGR